MDDFYSSMKEILDNSNNENLTKDRKAASSSFFVEALVPINPYKWESYVVGSASASDMPEIGDKLKTPFSNLEVAKEYLQTAQSDVQWRDRFWKLAEDTVKINEACELGGEVGSFGAGIAANKIADSYVEEMVETEITKNLQEELNLEIFKTVSLEKGLDPKEVRGAGVLREFVPQYMKEDICNRPERNERPLGWDSNGGLDEDGLGSGSSGPKNSPNDGSGTEGKFGRSGYNSNIFPDNPMTDEPEEDGGIFAKCLGWLGCCFGAPSPNSYYESSTMCPSELEKAREEAENSVYTGYCGGNYDLPPVGHPSLNPPLFFPEQLPPEW